MKIKRTHIAAGGTVAAMGVLAAVALGAGSSQPSEPAAAQKTPPVEVRTVVVHRTIRVVRHQKPKRPVAAAGPPASTLRSDQAEHSRSIAATPVPEPAKPLRTKSSGAASDDHEREDYEREDHGGEDYEREDDHHDGDDGDD